MDYVLGVYVPFETFQKTTVQRLTVDDKDNIRKRQSVINALPMNSPTSAAKPK